MKQDMPIAGQSITGQKFHNSFRVFDKSVSTPNLLETCEQVEDMYFLVMMHLQFHFNSNL